MWGRAGTNGEPPADLRPRSPLGQRILDLITNAADVAPVIEAFRGCDQPVQRWTSFRHLSGRPIVREANHDPR